MFITLTSELKAVFKNYPWYPLKAFSLQDAKFCYTEGFLASIQNHGGIDKIEADLNSRGFPLHLDFNVQFTSGLNIIVCWEEFLGNVQMVAAYNEGDELMLLRGHHRARAWTLTQRLERLSASIIDILAELTPGDVSTVKRSEIKTSTAVWDVYEEIPR